MPARLLDAMSNSPTKPDVRLLIRFMTLVGRLFQIRDDYMNLTSANVSSPKTSALQQLLMANNLSVHQAKGLL
jgi:geranylgeranyl pyrophosphate synthase